MFPKWAAFVAAGVVLSVACSSQHVPAVQDLAGGQDVANFALTSWKGTRDGDRVAVQAVFGDGSRTLTVLLQFRLTPQAKLERGTWAGFAGEGSVQERSVTFLGGQNGPPSMGGRFDLIGSGDKAIYRVSVPLQPLKDTL